MSDAKDVKSEGKGNGGVLAPFDLKMVGSCGLATIVGARGSGKTTMGFNVLEAADKETRARGAVFDPTPEGFVMYSGHTPLAYIHDNYDEKVFAKIVDHQSKSDAKPMYLILDNISSDPACVRSTVINDALAQSKALKWLAVYHAQYTMDVPTAVAKATDWWFFQPSTSYENNARLFKRLNITGDDRERVQQHVQTALENKMFIVVPGAKNRDKTKPVPVYGITPNAIVDANFAPGDPTKWSDLALDQDKFEQHVGSAIAAAAAPSPPPAPLAVPAHYAVLMNQLITKPIAPA